MKNKLRSVRRLSSWLWATWQGYRTQALLNTALGLVVVVIDLSFVWATKLAIDVATHVRNDITLTAAICLLVGLIVLQISVGVIARWVRAVLGVRAQNKMQHAFFSRLLNTEWLALRRFHTGDLLNRMEQDVRDVIRFLTEHLPTLASTLFQFVGAFLLLFYMDRQLAFIIVIILPFFMLASRLYVRRMRRITHEVRATESRIQSVLQESMQHSLVLKSLSSVGIMRDKLLGQQKALHSQVVERTRFAIISSGVMNVGFAVGYLIAFSWGVFSLQAGAITYGTLIAFIQLVGQIQNPVRSLTKFIPVFIGAFTATERLMELQEIPEETSAGELPAAFSNSEPEAIGVRLTNVTFSYEPTSRRILDNLSFCFPPKSVTAIVGETGAGKTTLIRLILAVLHPSQGSVSLYTEQGGELPASSATRGLYAYVPQGNTLLSGTIRENLLMGNPQATEQMMENALRTAAADFVLSLPLGIDTPVGEVGDGLSEGQAQRISIARALLGDRPLYIFDEATSALDSETERRVVRAIAEEHAGKTLIFVTHRPEVLNYCTQSLSL